MVYRKYVLTVVYLQFIQICRAVHTVCTWCRIRMCVHTNIQILHNILQQVNTACAYYVRMY